MMAVVPVINGQVIEKADIVSMHATLRSDINSMGQGDLGRYTFNEFQLPGICLGAAYKDTLASGPPVEVTKEVTSTDLESADLSTATLTKVCELALGSAGVYGFPCIVFITGTMHITGWSKQSGIVWARHCAIGAITAQLASNGVDFFPTGLTDQGIARARAGDMEDDYGGQTDQPGGIRQITEDRISFATYYDGSAEAGGFTLSHIKLWAAACRAGSSQSLEPVISTGYFRVSRATISAIAFRTS